MAFLAMAALFLTVASLFVVGGVVFALFLFFPLFVGALIGVLAGTEDRSVPQHSSSIDRRWRNGW
jgi:hypothetical protein